MNFHRPKFPANASFVQLVQTKDSKPIFSRGHWRQTLTPMMRHLIKPNRRTPARPRFRADDNYYRGYELGRIHTKHQPNDNNNNTSTDEPSIHSTLYYDDFYTSLNDTTIGSSSQFEQVSRHWFEFYKGTNLLSL